MAVRPILLHPDRRLRAIAKPVECVDKDVRALAEDMVDSMYAAEGIGLAATQIGSTSRVAVVDCDRESETRNPIVLVNPEIVEHSPETETREEGCLSIPEVYEEVERSNWVEVRYLDQDGTETRRRCEGVESVCVQHEIDHLDGKLFIDRIGPVKRRLITNRMRKLKRERERESRG